MSLCSQFFFFFPLFLNTSLFFGKKKKQETKINKYQLGEAYVFLGNILNENKSEEAYQKAVEKLKKAMELDLKSVPEPLVQFVGEWQNPQPDEEEVAENEEEEEDDDENSEEVN